MDGNPILLQEMVRNLVDNAVHYSGRGGVVTAHVLFDRFSGVQILQVEDNGPGIPENERELVLQPFYRALGTNVDGSGLGLAIVHEIAQQHGATVHMEDAHNDPAHRGLRVSVRFAPKASPLRGVRPGRHATTRALRSGLLLQGVGQGADHAVDLGGGADEGRRELDGVATVAHVKTLFVHGHGNLERPACGLARHGIDGDAGGQAKVAHVGHVFDALGGRAPPAPAQGPARAHAPARGRLSSKSSEARPAAQATGWAE